MFSYEDNVKKFENMNTEQKKNKLLAMLEYLKDDSQVFWDVYKLLNITNNVTDNLLLTIYKILAKSMASLDEKKIKESMDELNKVKNSLEKLRKQEEEEQKKEDKEADNLLESI